MVFNGLILLLVIVFFLMVNYCPYLMAINEGWKCFCFWNFPPFHWIVWIIPKGGQLFSQFILSFVILNISSVVHNKIIVKLLIRRWLINYRFNHGDLPWKINYWKLFRNNMINQMNYTHELIYYILLKNKYWNIVE